MAIQKRFKKRSGGGRLEALRTTHQHTKKHCKDLIAAAYASVAIGKPFNRFITLLWEKSGIDRCGNVKATAHFIRLASAWARGNGYRLIWAYVQEFGRVNFAHVHLLLHVPAHLDDAFTRLPQKWAAQCLPSRKYVTDLVQTRKLYPPKHDDLDGGAYLAELLGKVHYMLKCSPRAWEAELDMVGRGRVPWGQSCPTFGRRLSIWQGWKADADGV